MLNDDLHSARRIMLHTVLLQRDLFAFLDAIAQENADLSKISVLEGDFWLVQDPQLVAAVMQDAEMRFAKPAFLQQSHRAWHGGGLVPLNGDRWRVRRAVIQQAFSPAQYQRMQEIAREEATSWLLPLLRAQDSTQALDLAELFFQLSIRIQLRWTLSLEAGAADGIDWEELRAAWHQVDSSGAAAQLMPNKRLRAHQVPQLSEQISMRRRNGGGDDFFASFQQSCRQHGLELSEEEVFDEIAQWLFAGHHSMSASLVFCVEWLHRAPQWAAKLRREHQQEGQLEGSMRHFIKEVLRFALPTPLLFRQALSNCELAGREIAAGDLLAISPYLMHRDARWFPEPQSFLPERFAQPVERDAWLPFGAGSRRCLAMRLALTQIESILQVLLPACGLTPHTRLPENLFALGFPGEQYEVFCQFYH